MATTRRNPSTPIAAKTAAKAPAKPKATTKPAATPKATKAAEPKLSAEERLAQRPEYTLKCVVVVEGQQSTLVTIRKTYRHIANVREVGAHWLENHTLARGVRLVISGSDGTQEDAQSLEVFRAKNKAPDARPLTNATAAA